LEQTVPVLKNGTKFQAAALSGLISPRRETMSYSQPRPVQISRFESYAVDWNAFVAVALVVAIVSTAVMLFA
jgi:hypothetical protein